MEGGSLLDQSPNRGLDRTSLVDLGEEAGRLLQVLHRRLVSPAGLEQVRQIGMQSCHPMPVTMLLTQSERLLGLGQGPSRRPMSARRRARLLRAANMPSTLAD